MMKNPDNLARRNLWNAGTRVKSAELFYSRGEWPDTVRECREALDFTFKSLLHAQGVEINRFQNPGEIFSKERHRFPSAIAADWDRIGRIVSSGHASPEAGSFGGGSDFMTFGEDLFPPAAQTPPSSEDAQSALSDAHYMIELARTLCSYLRRKMASRS